MRFGGEMPPKPGSAQEKFSREQTRERELAEERRQANLERMAEKEGNVGEDVTEELERRQGGGSN